MKTSTRIKRLAEQAEQQPLLPVRHAGPGRGKTKKTPRGTQGGNSRDYLLRRLARDRPDILERLKQGAFATVRDAAKEAGWVRPPGPRVRQTGTHEWTVRQGAQTLGFLRQNKDERWTVWARNDTGEGFSPVARCGRFEEAMAWFQKEASDARHP